MDMERMSPQYSSTGEDTHVCLIPGGKPSQKRSCSVSEMATIRFA